MAGNIIGIVAQRLVRRLCTHCRKPYPAESHECKLIGVASGQPAPIIYRAAGCDHCEYQGYRGRIAIMEMLRYDGPVIFDCLVEKHENCFPMIPSGKPHNEMLLGDADTQGVIGSKGAVLV